MSRLVICRYILLLGILFHQTVVNAQIDSLSFEYGSSSKIGLTLSGGGAKGLAHIGVLHVIDSLEINIDYITGTSMGGIVGAMYATGYSAQEIEDFALNLDWLSLFASRSDLLYVPISTREEYGRYIAKLPYEDGKFSVITGAIEGQQMWIKLSEIFYHVYSIHEFDKLPIPFACVATNLETGEPIFLTEGNLVTALRASMAIPTLFTAVSRDSVLLIDGGVVQNFPVIKAKEMGADYVIGVNVSQGLRKVDELRTPFDIIYQMGFYSDARSFRENLLLTDLYLEPDLDGYSAASFSSALEIIEQGKIEARQNIEGLKKIANQQRSNKNESDYAPELLNKNPALVIDSVKFIGLNKINNWYIRNNITIQQGDVISIDILRNNINRLYATNYFERVIYQIEDSETEGRVNILLIFTEKSLISASLGLHYSNFFKIGFIGGWENNRFLFYNTTAYGLVRVGDQPAIRIGLKYYPSDRQKNWIKLETTGRYNQFPIYESFKKIAEYHQFIIRSEFSLNQQSGNHSYFSVGSQFYFQNLAPNTRPDIQFRGETSGVKHFFRWTHYSLDRHVFAESGQYFFFKGSFFHKQNQNLKISTAEGQPLSLDDLNINFKPFFQTQAHWKAYLPYSNNITQFTRLQAGYNFWYKQGFINSFNIGGIDENIDNHIQFLGLKEYEVITKSVVSGTIGWRLRLGSSFFTSISGNGAVYDFTIGEPESLSRDKFILGGGLSVGYLSLIGPLDITFAYSPQVGRITGYINLGWAF